MTISVLDITAGPFTLSAGPNVLPYGFMVFTPSEIELVVVTSGGVETVVDPSLYTVDINTDLAGNPIEGGTVTYTGTLGASVYLRAAPSFEQNQVFALLGFRPPTLNEAADRATLRDLRLKLDMLTVSGSLGTYVSQAQAASASAQASANVLANYVADIQTRPEFFGVVSGALSEAAAGLNRIKMQLALDAGVTIDGGGRSYDIAGTLEFEAASSRLKNITLRQRSTNLLLEKTLFADGLSSQIVIENVTIDMMGLQQSGGISQCQALQVSNCAKPVVRGCLIKNGGGITGMLIYNCTDPIIERNEIRDFAPSFSAQPTDDTCQAIEVQLCSNFKVTDNVIKNLDAVWPGRPAVRRQYSRGIAVGACLVGQVSNNVVSGVEQPIDITGNGNENIAVFGNNVSDGGGYGVKFANRFFNVMAYGNTIVRMELGGIVFSAPREPSAATPYPRNGEAFGNLIVDTGKRGLYPVNSDAFGPRGPTGVSVIGRAEYFASYPAGIKIHDNRILDNSAVPTTAWGVFQFQANVGADDSAFPLTAGVQVNEEYGNVIEGCANRAKGFSYHRADVFGAGTFDLPNNAWTSVSFTGTELEDSAGLHSTVTNPSRFTAKEAGVYSVGLVGTFQNVAGGKRGLRFLRNGGDEFGRCRVNDTAGEGVDAETAWEVYLGVGDRIEGQAYQNSGGTMSAVDAASFRFTMALVQRG